MEIELKLLVPAGAMRRLASHRLLGRSGPVRRARLRSVYYDTPALDLWRQGIALRLRHDGRRWLQAVKGGGTARGGLHQRLEEEVEVAGPAPDFTRIGDGALASALASPRLRARLAPVFTTDFTRASRVIELGGGTRVEASLDEGVIRGARGAEPVRELELELKSGEPARLYDLALALAEDVPLALGNRSKAQRGYALAGAAPDAPVKARAATLDRGMTAAEAFRAVMWAGLAHYQANEPGALAGADPEYLHQLRVALRRLRSAIGIFAPLLDAPALAALRADLRWLAGRLGPARDWDVFVTETLPPVVEAFGRRGGFRDFVARCERLRRAANARARRALRSARCRRLALRLSAWLHAGDWLRELPAARREALERPVAEWASAVLGRRYDRVRERGRGLARHSAGELHRLRIAIKKYRYAADFFASLYGKPARQALGRLSRLQDILGAMNDAANVAELTARGFDGGARVREARGIVLGWSRARATALRRKLKRAWKSFRAAEPFW
jgi:inorganic triphosphatase YgiF